MQKKRVFVTQSIPREGVDLLRRSFAVQVRSKHTVIPAKELRTAVKNADALLCTLEDPIDASIMDAGTRLRVISNFAVGVDNIDVAAATERGIVVTNTPGVLDEAVAEHTLALLLAVARRIVEADKFTRAHKYKAWMPLGFLGPELKGKTIGVIGAGRIGTTVAKAAHHGMGMNVLYTDIAKNTQIEKEAKAKYVSLKSLLQHADVVTVHVPLLPSTRHLIGAPQLRLMKKTAILINTSRGPVVAEKPLVRALQQRKLRGAGLDVYECEPYVDCDPTDRLDLTKLDSVVLTPHIASATEEARAAMSRLAAEGVRDTLLNKKPKNVVNPKVWSKRKNQND